MGVTVNFVLKGFVLCFFFFILHISFNIYRLHGSRMFCSVVSQNNSKHISTQLLNLIQPIPKPKGGWVQPVQNFTTISREFFKYLSRQLQNSSYPGIKSYTEYVTALTRLKPRPLTQVAGPSFNDLNHFSYSIEPQPCMAKIKNNLNVFVAVISAPGYFEKREIIRQTWKHHLRMQSNMGSFGLSGFGFIVGSIENPDMQTSIELESEAHGDILQMNVIDYYYNITLKVVGLLKWMNSRCSQVDFVLKVDDDVFVNVHNFISVIRNLDPYEQVMYGSRADGIPLRNRSNGKHYISLIDWPWSSFPPYLKGAALLIPGRVIRTLLEAAEKTPYFPFDDVYLSGLCSNRAEITLRFCDRFSVGYLTMYLQVPQPCYIHTSITWVTQSLEHFNMSYWATKNFYGNVTHCPIQLSYNTNKTSNHTELFKFDFVDKKYNED